MTLLFPTPVVYDGNDARYLRRDGARFLPALAVRGDRGLKVVLSSGPESPQPTSPNLRAGTFADWCDPDFWKAFHADGALCYFGFSARRFLPVVRALRAAGLRLALKADSSFGLHRFPRHAAVWFRKCYWVARERHAPPAALAKAALDMAKWIRGFPPGDMLPYLESFDAITVESPLAADNTREWLRRHRCPDLAGRVLFLPHPVPDDFAFDPLRDTKENRVLAVAADWRNPRKGGAVLGRALGRFLDAHPDWRATVVGARSDLVAAAAPRAAGRIEVLPALDAEALLPLYRASRLLVTASGSESGPIVAFEAFACDCSVVFPPELIQLSWMANSGRGAMASARTPAALAAAMERAAGHVPAPVAAPPVPPLHASEACALLARSLATSSPGSRTAAAATNHDCTE